MIVVAGRVTVRPDRREDAIRVAQTMARATQAEVGCISYRFYADLESPSVLFIFEEWKSETDLARHFQTAHMAAFQAELPGLVGGPAEVKKYVVESIGSI